MFKEYLSSKWTAKAQVSLHICQSLHYDAHTIKGTDGSSWQRSTSLALLNGYTFTNGIIIWTVSSEFGTYRLCEQRRFRRACASAQSRQNRRCSVIQAVSQEESSHRKPDHWPLWMAGHAQLKFVMTECSKTQIRLTGLIWSNCVTCSDGACFIWATAWKKNDLCTQRRLRSAWASVLSDQCSLCTLSIAKDPMLLHADSDDWSDWANAQADLSLR